MTDSFSCLSIEFEHFPPHSLAFPFRLICCLLFLHFISIWTRVAEAYLYSFAYSNECSGGRTEGGVLSQGGDFIPMAQEGVLKDKDVTVYGLTFFLTFFLHRSIYTGFVCLKGGRGRTCINHWLPLLICIQPVVIQCKGLHSMLLSDWSVSPWPPSVLTSRWWGRHIKK